MLAGERTGWCPEDRRGVGQDRAARKLPGARRLEVGAAALVDRIEDGLVPGRDRFPSAVVLAPDVDEVGVGDEGPAERPAVGLVPGPLQAPDQFGGYALCSLGHVCTSAIEPSVG